MILFKTTEHRVNYYKINVFPTLFGDFLIQKEYGVADRVNPTNIIKEYTNTNREALLRLLDLAVDKKSLGYTKAA